TRSGCPFRSGSAGSALPLPRLRTVLRSFAAPCVGACPPWNCCGPARLQWTLQMGDGELALCPHHR
ncbi:hypothetical protein BC830DRAFT_1114636, partial [Chytriomyces sp. MP71]